MAPIWLGYAFYILEFVCLRSLFVVAATGAANAGSGQFAEADFFKLIRGI